MLNGKTAVITGASRGIGAAVAEKFAHLGANVAIIYQANTDKAEDVCRRARDLGAEAEIYKCDVSDYDECKKTVAEVIGRFGKIDILVNNAGITRDNLIAMMSEDDFNKVVGTNLGGCFNMIKACSRNFIRNKGGRIINIASVSALLGLAGQSNYAASKAGIIALTKTAAREFAAKNICVNAIAPGFITTDMTESLSADEIVGRIPLKRLGRPEDVANLAAFLADEASGYITGETIRIDGGLAI